MKMKVFSPPVNNWKKLVAALPLLFALVLFQGCSSSTAPEETSGETDNSANVMKDAEEMKDDGLGIGPVKSVEIPADIDAAMAESGQKLFEAKCTACHKFSADKYVGPGLLGITKRRKPEWIMNMILNPTEMTQQDPTAKELLATHLTQMTNQNVAEPEARSIYEYFRKMDAASN